MRGVPRLPPTEETVESIDAYYDHPRLSRTDTRALFSKDELSTVMDVFRLPAATLETICSDMFHFQQHTIALDAVGLPSLGR